MGWQSLGQWGGDVVRVEPLTGGVTGEVIVSRVSADRLATRIVRLTVVGAALTLVLVALTLVLAVR